MLIALYESASVIGSSICNSLYVSCGSVIFMVHLKVPPVCHICSSGSFFMMTNWSGTILVYFTWRLLVQELSAQMWNKLVIQKNDKFINKCFLPLISYFSVWPYQVMFLLCQCRGKLGAGQFLTCCFKQMDFMDWCPQWMIRLPLHSDASLFSHSSYNDVIEDQLFFLPINIF